MEEKPCCEQEHTGGKYDEHNETRIVSVDDWKTILKNELARSEKKFNFIDSVLIKIYYAPNRTVFRGEFEKKIGIKGLNLRVGEFRDRIRKLKNIDFEEQINDDTGNERAWNIPFRTDQKLNNASKINGRFSWVLRDELAKAMEELGLVHPDGGKAKTSYNNGVKDSNSKSKKHAHSEKRECSTRVLFCNVAYMKKYDIELFPETPTHGGDYINRTGDALEKSNFHKCEDDTVKGFVETMYVGGYDNTENKKPKELRIENIDKKYKDQDKIKNVTVIFCAKNPDKKVDKTVIVGWYKNATVYRRRKEYLGRPYNLEAEYKNAYLLPENERIKIVPRARSNEEKIGFGQSNVWYANKENHKGFVKEVLDYIDEWQVVLKEKEIKRINSREDEVLNESINKQKIIEKPFKYTDELVCRKEPRISTKGLVVYKRDKRRAINAISHSKFKCENNLEHVTFKRKVDGLPYMEPHHLIPMSKQDLFEYSLDVEENIISLCSNCHNEIHYGKDAEKLIKKLYHQRIKLLKKKKIGISLKELLSYYGF